MYAFRTNSRLAIMRTTGDCVREHIALGWPGGEGWPGIGGSGALVNLSFQAVGRGETRVSVEDISLKDTKGQAIAATTTQVVVKLQ